MVQGHYGFTNWSFLNSAAQSFRKHLVEEILQASPVKCRDLNVGEVIPLRVLQSLLRAHDAIRSIDFVGDDDDSRLRLPFRRFQRLVQRVKRGLARHVKNEKGDVRVDGEGPRGVDAGKSTPSTHIEDLIAGRREEKPKGEG